MVFFIILYSLLLLINSITLIKSFKINKWSIFNYSYCYLVIFYNLTPLIIYVYKYLNIEYKSAYLDPDLNINYDVQLFLYLTICIAFLVYNIIYNKLKYRFRVKKIYNLKVEGLNITYLFLILLTLISSISLFLYIKGFGSFTEAISNTDLIRSGNFKDQNSTKNTGFTVFQRFINISLIPLLYFFYTRNKSFLIRILFIISLVNISISYIFLSGSRQSIIDIFLIFIIARLIKYNKIINTKLLISLLLALFILPYLDTLFISLSYSENKSFIVKNETKIAETIINEFGFPFYSLYNSILYEYNYYFFSDFYVELFGKYLPSSWGPNIKATNYQNSFLTGGLINLGYIPPGIIAQGYYSLNILGVIIIMSLTSIYFKFIDSYFNYLLKLDSKIIIFYSFFIIKSLSWIRTGLPGNYFYNIVIDLSLIFILIILRKK